MFPQIRYYISLQVTNTLQQLKGSLVTAPVLKMLNFERPFVVMIDASSVSVGAILEQDLS